MSGTNKTTWLRLLAEATAIILSILAAFAIDAWWEDAQQQKHLHSVLGFLEAEFVENIDLINQNIDYVNADQAYLKLFINMSPEDASKILSDRTFATLVAIWRPGTEISNNNFIIGMLESENLPLLDYPRLQEAIAGRKVLQAQIHMDTLRLLRERSESVLIKIRQVLAADLG